MSHQYNFIKSVNPDVLKDMLLLTSIWRKIENVHFSEDSNEVEVMATEVLVSADEDILNGVINDYSDTHALAIRHNFEKSAIGPAMSFGMELIGKIGSNNVVNGKTATQIQAMFDNHSPLILMLVSGSLIMAHAYIGGMTATADFTQSEIDEFERRLEVYLGLDIQN